MKPIIYNKDNYKEAPKELQPRIEEMLKKSFQETEWIINTNVDETLIPTRGKWDIFKSTENRLEDESIEHYLERSINGRMSCLLYETEDKVRAEGRVLDCIFTKKELPSEKVKKFTTTILYSKDSKIPDIQVELEQKIKQVQIDFKSHRPTRYRPEEKSWKSAKKQEMKYQPIEVQE